MDQAIKKQALRHFTYGLYAVSCAEGDEVNAFTANWLTQVSFEPPLLAVSIENDSKSLPMIERTRKFAVNTLHRGPEEVKLAGTLGKSALKYPNKLAGIGHTVQQDGYVLIDEALSWVACEVRQVMPAGDSTLVVAEIVDAGILGEGEPLTMREAGFRHAG
jgi:flavin reductase (DIM6/NTAB) family NADH-FMN oxidoreductase RutF